MTEMFGDPVESFLHQADRTIWSTAALVVAFESSAPEGHRATARAVLDASGLSGMVDREQRDAGALTAQAAAPVHQVAALLRGEGAMWATQSDEALLAQGRTSARGAAAFAQFGLPMLTGLEETFAQGARMLDVGTGVGALAVAYAELFPALTVVGIDVMPRVLAMAERTVRDSSVAGRVQIREQDVSSLEDLDTYALAWVPAPFIPEAALGPGVPRVVAALQPGGWLMLGHGKYGGTALDDALGRFKTVAYGGTALDDEQGGELLRSAGLVDVRTLPTPEGMPALTVGRRPPAVASDRH